MPRAGKIVHLRPLDIKAAWPEIPSETQPTSESKPAPTAAVSASPNDSLRVTSLEGSTEGDDSQPSAPAPARLPLREGGGAGRETSGGYSRNPSSPSFTLSSSPGSEDKDGTEGAVPLVPPVAPPLPKTEDMLFSHRPERASSASGSGRTVELSTGREIDAHTEESPALTAAPASPGNMSVLNLRTNSASAGPAAHPSASEHPPGEAAGQRSEAEAGAAPQGYWPWFTTTIQTLLRGNRVTNNPERET